MSPVDAALLKRWTDHRDAEAFNDLVTRYAGMVFATCKRVLGNPSDAEEVTQDCFLQLASGRARIRTSLGGWLHSAATSLALNRIRQDIRRHKREHAAATAAPKTVEPTWDDIQLHIDEAIAQLPERFRDPLIRHFLQRETHDEIARDLGLSRSAVTQRIANGIEQVRVVLNRRGVMVTAAAFSALLAARTAEAAPAGLLASLGRLALTSFKTIPAASGALASSAAVSSPVLFAIKATASGLLISALLAAAGYAYFTREPRPQVVARAATSAQSVIEKPQVPSASVLPEIKSASGAVGSFPDPPRTPTLDVGVVRGSVLDSQGVPQPGVEVVLERLADVDGVKKLGSYHRTTVTGEHGDYEITDVPLLVDSANYIADNRLCLHAALGEMYGKSIFRGDPLVREYFTNLVLSPAKKIEGRVTDRSGSPISGARVDLMFDFVDGAGRHHSDVDYMRVSSDSNGHFATDFLFTGPYLLTASAEGYSRNRVPGVQAGTKGIQIQLAKPDPQHIVRGKTIHASTNDPVPNLEVTAWSSNGMSLGVATSGTDGSFNLAVDKPESECTITISPRSRGSLCLKDGPVKIELSDNDLAPNPVTLLLIDGGTVAGRVIDAGTGAGLPGVLVGGERTDAAGTFRIAGLKGESTVTLSSHQALPPCSAAITVNPGQAYDAVDLVLEKRFRISGVVQDSDGKPLVSAAVCLAASDKDNRLAFALKSVTPIGSVTDDLGRFVLFTPGPTQGLRIQAVHDKGVSRCIGPFDLGDEGLQGLVVRIEPVGQIEGDVVDEQGKRLQDAIVVLRPLDPGLAIVLPASGLGGRSGSHPGAQGMMTWWGAFSFSYVLPGKYNLEAYFDGWSLDSPAVSKAIDVQAGEPLREVKLVASSRSTGAIEGWVTKGSNPVTGATVVAHNNYAGAFGEGSQRQICTGPDGHFYLDHISPAPLINMMVSLPGSGMAGQQHAVVEAGKVTTVRFDLAAGAGVLEGTFRISGQPKSGALIRLEPRTLPLNSEYPAASTDEHGYYQIAGVDPGQYQLTAIVDGDELAPFASLTVDVKADGPTYQDMDVGGASITVKLKGMAKEERAILVLLPGQVEIKELTRELVESLKPRLLRLIDNIIQDRDYAFRGLDAGDYTVAVVAAPPVSVQVPDRYAVARFACATLALSDNQSTTTDLEIK
ncbi:MAG: sigma-70 family RNA polymerase sigma factor [Candidatus Hydrogenedentes bacterium]|nr:sigma-70 family RNA polymerase sigma factor [Candidatus Hydrogenedentota bacterium]